MAADLFSLLTAFVTGCCFSLLILWLWFRGMHAIEGRHNAIYSIEHARLSIGLPPPSFWMNMGFWKPSTTSFPHACSRLLEEMLDFAGFHTLSNEADSIVIAPPPTSTSKKLRILDIGTGCGDQSLHLLRARRPDGAPLVDSYIGLTASRVQAELGASRVRALLEAEPKSRDVQMLCRDGARPATWASACTSYWESADTVANGAETWLLGLDALYHLAPSRVRLLRFACTQLAANVAAFDVVLAPGATFAERLMLRLICPLLGTPYGNLLTPAAYEAMLRQAGFPASGIHLRDISADVLPGLAAFLRRRDRELRAAGLGGLGALRAALWLFEWWARSGVVRTYLVAARSDGTRNHHGHENAE